MGFWWHVNVSVEFTQEVEVPMYLSRFVKRLIQWQPPTPSAADVMQREVGKRAGKRKAAAIITTPRRATTPTSTRRRSRHWTKL